MQRWMWSQFCYTLGQLKSVQCAYAVDMLPLKRIVLKLHIKDIHIIEWRKNITLKFENFNTGFPVLYFSQEPVS